MKYDFDSVIERRGTHSIKYNLTSSGMPPDVLPMWVADMDFQSPPCVLEALTERVKHGIFGYSHLDAAYYKAVGGWFERRFGWHIESEWIAITPGVVNAIYVAIRALTGTGDGVLVQQPVYYPFMSAIKQTGRKLLINELTYSGGKYSIDFNDFEDKIKQAKLFILCSPHNPVGRVWTLEELTRIGELCLRYGVTVIADEIHQDFIYPDNKHLVFANLGACFKDITITCTAPSKTFNLAGLPHANIIISNPPLRNKFTLEYGALGLGQPEIMGIVACKAAYESGGGWLDELLKYLLGNMTLISDFLSENIPQIKLVKPEGTYLAWLDCTGLGLAPRELNEWVINKAKLWLNDGAKFGCGGAGFQRLNAACPRSVLREGLERLKAAVNIS